MTSIVTQCLADNDIALYQTLESFRFEDENEDEDEDEALGFRHKEIFKLFRLQLGRDNVVAINFVVPAKLKTKKFKDFVVAKTESFVLVLDFVLVFESKAIYWPACGPVLGRQSTTLLCTLLCRGYVCPTCNRSMIDMTRAWRMLHCDVSRTPMPEEYNLFYVKIDYVTVVLFVFSSFFFL